MYHTSVRRQIRRAYRLINAGQVDALVAQFAPDAVFAFPGEHVLGGEFRGPDAVRAWLAEVRRLFPDSAWRPGASSSRAVLCTRTSPLVFAVSGTFPDGTPYCNQGAQLLELQRRRVQEERLFEDTTIVVDALDRLRALGMDPGATLPPWRARHSAE